MRKAEKHGDGEGVIPDVFKRMPIETLEKYARHGVIGARQELRRREAEPAKPLAPRSDTQR